VVHNSVWFTTLLGLSGSAATERILKKLPQTFESYGKLELLETGDIVLTGDANRGSPWTDATRDQKYIKVCWLTVIYLD
jgi:hypothetical protein